MPIDFDADLAAIFKDAGKPVTFPGGSTYGVVNLSDEVLLQFREAGANVGGVIGAEIVVEVATASIPGVVTGTQITVDGTAYKVRYPLRVEDGAITRLLLAKVP